MKTIKSLFASLRFIGIAAAGALLFGCAYYPGAYPACGSGCGYTSCGGCGYSSCCPNYTYGAMYNYYPAKSYCGTYRCCTSCTYRSW